MIDLDGLRAHRIRLDRDKSTFFDDWPVEPETRGACWQSLADCVDALIALGSDGDHDDAANVLRECVEAYNELDTGFITTLEREDLCDKLYEVGQLAGFDPVDEWVEDYREW